MPAKPPAYLLGSMSFSQPDWAGAFYPRGLKSTDWLEYYATAYDTVELDTTFYAVPPAERFEEWGSVVPAQFRFTMKAPRSVTHDAPIDQGVPEMSTLIDRAYRLGEKLGVILLQFPPTFSFTQFEKLEAFLHQLPRAVRYAVEFRESSWFEKENRPRVFDLLSCLRICWASAEYLATPRPPIVTTDFCYVRFVGEHDRFSVYTHEHVNMSASLLWWKDQLDAVPDTIHTIYGFFNNDYSGYSIDTCNRFKQMIGQPVRKPTPKQGELFG